MLAFVGVIENALNETETIGVKPDSEHRQKYTLDKLLSDDFRLPRKRARGGLMAMAMANPDMVGRWKEVPLEQNVLNVGGGQRRLDGSTEAANNQKKVL